MKVPACASTPPEIHQVESSTKNVSAMATPDASFHNTPPTTA